MERRAPPNWCHSFHSHKRTCIIMIAQFASVGGAIYNSTAGQNCIRRWVGTTMTLIPDVTIQHEKYAES